MLLLRYSGQRTSWQRPIVKTPSQSANNTNTNVFKAIALAQQALISVIVPLFTSGNGTMFEPPAFFSFPSIAYGKPGTSSLASRHAVIHLGDKTGSPRAANHKHIEALENPINPIWKAKQSSSN